MAKKKTKKASAKRKSESPFELAVVVSDRVQIADVRMVRFEAEQTPRAKEGKHRVEWTTPHVETQVDPQSGRIGVLPTFRMTAFPAESEDQEFSVRIEATFLLAYDAETLEGLDEDNINSFGRVNGTYNAWPYWREFVQNTIARMGLDRLIAPVFRLGAPKSEASAKRPSGTKKRLSEKPPRKKKPVKKRERRD